MIYEGDKIALVGCSDYLKNYSDINNLTILLQTHKITPVVSDLIFRKNTTGSERAEDLEKFFKDPEIKMIFDVSGGNLSNEILDYLDFDLISENYKPFFGYSDLTPVVNAIAEKTGNETYLWQIRNILKSRSRAFFNMCFRGSVGLFRFNYNFIQGHKMEGNVVGGNIRCLLKTAGTPYFPDLKNKILFLESYSTESFLLRSFFAQLKQMGAFNQISGLLLGTFTKLEKDSTTNKILDIVLEKIPDDLPLAKTQNIGHSSDSACLKIGSRLYITDKSQTYQGF